MTRILLSAGEISPPLNHSGSEADPPLNCSADKVDPSLDDSVDPLFNRPANEVSPPILATKHTDFSLFTALVMSSSRVPGVVLEYLRCRVLDYYKSLLQCYQWWTRAVVH